MQFLPIIIAVIVVLVVAGTIVAVMMNREAERKKRMMSVIKGTSAGGEAQVDEQDLQNKRRAEIAKKLKDEKEEEKEKDAKKATLGMQIEQAGLSSTVTQYWIVSAISMVVFIGLTMVLAQPPIVLLLAAVIGFFGFPRFVLKN